MRVSSTLVFLTLFGIIGLTGCDRQHASGVTGGDGLVNASEKSTAVVSAPAEFLVTAEQLRSESRSNPKAMDRYAGKIVEIVGKLENTALADGNTVITLETGDPAIPVSCKMAEGAAASAQVLAKGEAVKLKCTGDEHRPPGTLSFSDCQVKKLN